MKKVIITVAIIVITLVLALLYNMAGRPVRTSGTALIGGAFSLVDTKGNTIRDTDFRGKLMLVYFGFTYCPDICPMGLQTISRALELLGADSKEVQPVFITIDPERDTIKQMADYLQHFNPQIMGLTGTKEQVAKAAAAYRVYYNKVPAAKGQDYLMDHSSYSYLMDRKGNYVTHFASTVTAEQMAATLKKYL